MSEACSGGSGDSSALAGAAAFRAAEWLSLAAAPTFAIMALQAGFVGDGSAAMLCSAHASPLSGMTPMYWLMSAFHSAPWLKLMSGRRAVPRP
jgi:hypothetical protein